MPRERYPRPGKGQNLRGLSLLAGLREKEGREESGTGGGIGPGRGRSALHCSGRKGRNDGAHMWRCGWGGRNMGVSFPDRLYFLCDGGGEVILCGCSGQLPRLGNQRRWGRLGRTWAEVTTEGLLGTGDPCPGSAVAGTFLSSGLAPVCVAGGFLCLILLSRVARR